jgi:hypothetical protein
MSCFPCIMDVDTQCRWRISRVEINWHSRLLGCSKNQVTARQANRLPSFVSVLRPSHGFDEVETIRRKKRIAELRVRSVLFGLNGWGIDTGMSLLVFASA